MHVAGWLRRRRRRRRRSRKRRRNVNTVSEYKWLRR
jgi:hypothetical protein